VTSRGRYRACPGSPFAPTTRRRDQVRRGRSELRSSRGGSTAVGIEKADSVWTARRTTWQAPCRPPRRDPPQQRLRVSCVMAQSAYFGVYCRRWGVPLIDGATVRLPRLVGLGKALEIIMTARKVTAEECYRIGLCEKVGPPGQAKAAAEAMAGDCPFPTSEHAGRPPVGHGAWGSPCARGWRASGQRAPASSRPKASLAQGASPRARAGMATSRTF
jgi:hypothetical protein